MSITRKGFIGGVAGAVAGLLGVKAFTKATFKVKSAHIMVDGVKIADLDFIPSSCSACGLVQPASLGRKEWGESPLLSLSRAIEADERAQKILRTSTRVVVS